MHVTIVQIRVKAERVEEFIAATKRNHAGAVAEPGTVCFDFLQLADDPTRFVLYEVYTTAEAAAAHKSTSHYLAWKQVADGMMAEPRVGTRCVALSPLGSERG